MGGKERGTSSPHQLLGIKLGPPQNGALTPSTSLCDLIWKQVLHKSR